MNETRWITRSQVDPDHWLEHASALCCCTVRASRWWWINERSNNLLRVRSVRIGATRCDDTCENTVLLETQGPCGSVRKCGARTATDATSVLVKRHSTHAVPIHMPPVQSTTKGEIHSSSPPE